jgi:hypothetical protein
MRIDELVKENSDTTPIETRIILLVVLAITSVVFFLINTGLIAPQHPPQTALLLWLFTVLFIFRVLGQILVALKPRTWLPPMEQWNFIPYWILLPIQLVFIVVMVWVDISFTSETGVLVIKNPTAGDFLIWFSALYALSMAIRYTIRMIQHAERRWFGGTIPIVFHVVLASYLYVLGHFYVS